MTAMTPPERDLAKPKSTTAEPDEALELVEAAEVAVAGAVAEEAAAAAAAAAAVELEAVLRRTPLMR